MITMGLAPNSSSPSSNDRPTTGFTPSMGRKSVETNSARTCSVSPATVRLNEYPRETPIIENVVFCFRQSRKFGNEIEPASKFGLLSCSVTSCSGSGYGKGFSSTPFTTENSAVFAPMPSASVRIATAVNPGDFVIILTPNRKSCISRSSDPQPHTPAAPRVPPLPSFRLDPHAPLLTALDGSVLPRQVLLPASSAARNSRAASSVSLHLLFVTSLLCCVVISHPAAAPPRSRPKAATISSVLLSVASFLPPSVGKTLPAACFRRFSIPL